MAATTPKSGRNDFTVTIAEPSDLPSLSTIFPRSFHPVNAHMRSCMPDTPLTRNYWHSAFSATLPDPSSHVLIARTTAPKPSALATTTVSDPPISVIGVLILRHIPPAGDRATGFWTSQPWTTDHDASACNDMISAIFRWRELYMPGREHFCVELFGVDYAWKGCGVGGALLKRACELIDAEGLEGFVQANATAYGFYEREGFRVWAEEVMPGEAGYTEYCLVRPAAGKGTVGGAKE